MSVVDIIDFVIVVVVVVVVAVVVAVIVVIVVVVVVGVGFAIHLIFLPTPVRMDNPPVSLLLRFMNQPKKVNGTCKARRNTFQ